MILPLPVLLGLLALAFAVAFVAVLLRSRPTLWEVGVVPMFAFSATVGNLYRLGQSLVVREDYPVGDIGDRLYGSAVKIEQLKIYDTSQMMIASTWAMILVVAIWRGAPDTDLGKALWSAMAAVEAADLAQRLHCYDPMIGNLGLNLSKSSCNILYGPWADYLMPILALAIMLIFAAVQYNGNRFQRR